MFLADVVGTVVSSVQIPILDGEKLLVLRPVGPDGKPTGRTRIGIDRAQAGVGDRVLVLDEGSSARQILDDPKGAVKTVIVGVVDYVEVEGNLAYDHRTEGHRTEGHRVEEPLADTPRADRKAR